MDGDKLGAEDGSTDNDGLDVGSAVVGFNVGLDVGFKVGLDVGFKVGLVVGANVVGDNVGGSLGGAEME